MLRLRVIQAEHGDSFVLEFGTTSAPRFVLIDGGPARVYRNHLRAQLQGIQTDGGKLDLAVLSHVDDDHVKGLLDLLAELQKQRKKAQPETIALSTLWHNSFTQTMGEEVADRLRMLMADVGPARAAMPASDRAERSIPQGDQLARSAKELGIPLNPQFEGSLICVDDAPAPVKLGNLRLQVIGPTRANLQKLRRDWLDWIKKNQPAIRTRDVVAAEKAAHDADGTTPNLSSIMLLATANEKTILLLGDGRHDHIVQGLQQAGLLDASGRMHVNVLKVPHHASSRNVTPEFFRAISADVYVISANGRDDNPEPDVLRWIVEAAKEQGRTAELFVTNETDSTRGVVKQFPPAQYGYRLRVMDKTLDADVIDLALVPGPPIA